MNSHCTITKRHTPSPRRGFSLVEITISAALLSTITIALGLALFRTQHRASDAQAAFTDLHNRNKVIRQIADDLHWAVEINNFDPNTIVFKVSMPDNPGSFEQLGYSLDVAQNTLLCLRIPGGPTVIAENVTLFQITAQTDIQGPDTYFNSITIKLRIGTDNQTLIERVIPLANRPPFR